MKQLGIPSKGLPTFSTSGDTRGGFQEYLNDLEHILSPQEGGVALPPGDGRAIWGLGLSSLLQGCHRALLLKVCLGTSSIVLPWELVRNVVSHLVPEPLREKLQFSRRPR